MSVPSCAIPPVVQAEAVAVTQEFFEIRASNYLAPRQTLIPTRAVVYTGAAASVICADMLPEGWCWDSKIVPLSYSHNTCVNGPEEFKLIVQHSS